MQNISFISRNIFKKDAVGNFCIDFFSLLHRNFSITVFAQGIDPQFSNIFYDSSFFVQKTKHDTFLLNYSIFDEFYQVYMDMQFRRSIIYYHNVTPGFFYHPFNADFANHLDAAVTQYPRFSQFDAVIANSQFSLDQIRPYLRPDAEALVFPPYFSLSRVQGAEEPVPAEFSARHSLLWVGRITPHKRPELALRIADELVRSGVDISLTFVGGGRYDFPAFAQHLQACLEDLDPRTRERIRFLEGLTDEQLTWLYRHSDLLLCTSAHEGYCMPLAEAAACGLPVAAMPQPAVLETLNGGGIVLSEDPAGAAGQIATFLETADEAERRASIPVLKPLPTDALLRLITGEK